MAADFASVFAVLKPVLAKYVKSDTRIEYTLVTKSALFLQHKGKPLYFASLRLGKAYVSFHLMPLHLNPALTKSITPPTKKANAGQDVFQFQDRTGARTDRRIDSSDAREIQGVGREKMSLSFHEKTHSSSVYFSISMGGF
jgi:hypothetical protein